MKRIIGTSFFLVQLVWCFPQSVKFELVTINSGRMSSELNSLTPQANLFETHNLKSNFKFTKCDLLDQPCDLDNYKLIIPKDFVTRRNTGEIFSDVLIGTALGVFFGWGLGALTTKSYTEGESAPWLIGGGIFGIFMFAWAVPISSLF